jgi:hypothetical protein
MPEIIHFRGSDKIISKKHRDKDVKATLEYVEDALTGSIYRRELLHEVLQEMGWRENGTLNILEGRRYSFKGFKDKIGIEGNFSAYEYILEGLLRLQLGFDKGKIDVGILMLTSQRSEKSTLGTSAELAKKEVEMLYPRIDLPVTIALFNLGPPNIPEEGGGEKNGIPVSADDNGKAPKAPTPQWSE